MNPSGFAAYVTPAPRGDARPQPTRPAKTIPFDYAFQFALQGRRGNKVQDVVEISSEGVFVALSVGYSLVLDERSTARRFEPVIERFVLPQNPVMVPFFSDTGARPSDLVGVRMIGAPGAEVVVFSLNSPPNTSAPEELPTSRARGVIGSDGTVTIDFQDPISTGSILRVWDKTNDRLGEVFVVDAPSTPVIGPNPTTGELPAAGDTSVHVYGWPGTSATTSVTVSLLKNADGTIVERTLDLVKDPDSFRGRTTGRVELTLQEGEDSTPVPLAPGDVLYVRITEPAVPILLAASPAEPQVPGASPAEPIASGAPPAEPQVPGASPAEPIASGAPPAESQVPAASPAESQVPAASPAESIASNPRVPFSMYTVPLRRERAVSDLTLAELEAGLTREAIGADLTRGFRLNPNAANLVAADLPLDRLSDGTLGRIFETGSVAAEEVSFFYSFDVGGTGREHQNRPIHNIAGLGIANGDRPSRPFARPLVFEPRSSIRLQIEEISGPAGTLFIVLQGYKILGAGRIPG